MIVYADYVESPLAQRWSLPEIFPRDRGDEPALVLVNGGLPGLYIKRGPGLDFDKAKNVVFPCNQVDLPAAARRAEISGHHGVAQLSEVEVGCFFSALAGELMLGNFLGRKSMLGEPIQKMEQGTSGTAGEEAAGDGVAGKQKSTPVYSALL